MSENSVGYDKLNAAGKLSTLLSSLFWRGKPNDDVKLSNWKFHRQRKPTAVNISFATFTGMKTSEREFANFVPTLNNQRTLHLSQKLTNEMWFSVVCTLTSNGNETHCFPRGQSLSVLLYLPTQNRTIHGCQLTNLFCEVLGSFRPNFALWRSLSTFSRHCRSPIRKRIWVGRYNNKFWPLWSRISLKIRVHSKKVFFQSVTKIVTQKKSKRWM